METWKHSYIVSTHNRLQYITELTSFCLEYISCIHHPRIFLHSIHHAWCLWVKMKLVSDDWLTGEGVAFLPNENTQDNKISGDIFNSTDISPSDLPTHPHRQYNDLSTDSNSRKWLFYSIDISPPDLPTPTIQWLVDRLWITIDRLLLMSRRPQSAVVNFLSTMKLLIKC